MNREPAAPIPAGGGIPRSWWKHLLKGILLCMAAGAAVSLINIEGHDWARLGEIRPWVVLLLLAMVGIAWVCNGLRTFLLARAFGHRLSPFRAVGITLSMEFAIAATPGGFGGLPTRIYLQRRSGIPVHHSLTMIAADTSADILFFLLLLPFALRSLLRLEAVQRLPEMISLGQAGLLAGTFVVVLAVVFLARKRLFRAGTGRRRRALRVRVKREWQRMKRSVVHLWREGRGWYLAAFLLASVQWSCRYGILPIILISLGASIDPFALIYLQGFLFLLGLLVVLPGGGGSLEILSTWILQPVTGAATAALAVVLWRLFTYYLYILGGALAASIQLLRPASAPSSEPIAFDSTITKEHDHAAT